MQHFKVAIYDVDDKQNLDDLTKHDFIGQAGFTLADVVTAGKSFTIPLILLSDGK